MINEIDIEQSYNEWVYNNLYYIRENKDHIKIMKTLYIEGFKAGYDQKFKYFSEEQLQK